MVCIWLEGTTAFGCCNVFTHVLMLWDHKAFYLVLQSQGQALCILEMTLGYRPLDFSGVARVLNANI